MQLACGSLKQAFECTEAATSGYTCHPLTQWERQPFGTCQLTNPCTQIVPCVRWWPQSVAAPDPNTMCAGCSTPSPFSSRAGVASISLGKHPNSFQHGKRDICGQFQSENTDNSLSKVNEGDQDPSTLNARADPQMQEEASSGQRTLPCLQTGPPQRRIQPSSIPSLGVSLTREERQRDEKSAPHAGSLCHQLLSPIYPPMGPFIFPKNHLFPHNDLCPPSFPMLYELSSLTVILVLTSFSDPPGHIK